MDSISNEEIVDKLDGILRILTVMAVKGLKQREQIALLDQAAFQPRDIANLLKTSGNTVRVELFKLRKSKVKKQPKKKSSS